MQREHLLSGSPSRFAESPLAAIWERASDGHALAAGNIACIREARRAAEERHLRPSPGKPAPPRGDGAEGFRAVLWPHVAPDLPEPGRFTFRERLRFAHGE